MALPCWFRRGLVATGVVTAAAVVTAPFALKNFVRRRRGEVFDSDGAGLHYTVTGEGEPVVLLHGFAVSSDLNWRLPGVLQALAGEFQVITLDLRGHGASDHPQAYGQEMVEDVIRLLDHLGIERAHLAGYSLGGVITLKTAATHPERLLSAATLGSGWESPDNSMFLGAIDEIATELEAGRGVGPLAQHLGDDREEPGAVHKAWVRFMTSFLNEGPALAGVVRGIPELVVQERDLERLELPVCAIVGERDPMANGAEAMVGKVANLEFLLIEGADHITTTRHPKLRATLIEFLRRNGTVEVPVA